MNHARPRLAFRWLISAFLVFAATGMASANYVELLRRVPDSANTLIMIDVERMLMNPIAMKEKWRDKANSSDGEPLHFPVNAERYMLASKVDYVSNFDEVWDAALIETTSDISLPYLSKMEGGYLDTVEGQQVAFSPRNAFLVLFKPRILGLSFPANKQDLGRWLRKTQRRDEPQVSDYLQNAVTLAHGKDHIVAAFDLGDMFTSRQVRGRLQRAESKRVGSLHAASAKDCGDPQENDIKVQSRVLITSAGARLHRLRITQEQDIDHRSRLDCADIVCVPEAARLRAHNLLVGRAHTNRAPVSVLCGVRCGVPGTHAPRGTESGSGPSDNRERTGATHAKTALQDFLQHRGRGD